jgi:carboxyl-terminal processing protease
MLTRQPTPGQVVRFGNLPPFVARVESERLRLPAGGTAGFIRFNVWMVPLMRDLDVAVEQLGDTDGIVLDLRGNPGGVSGMLIGLAGHFFRERVSLGTMRTRESELQLFVNPRLVAASGRAAQPFGGPVAILVDALSFSASELFAGGMQATGRARVFGEPSQGAVLGARFDRLPNGDILGHAMADFLLPTGARLEGRGVQPDTLVRSTRGLLLAGRDAPLDAALDWIANEARKARTRPDHQVAVGWR